MKNRSEKLSKAAFGRKVLLLIIISLSATTNESGELFEVTRKELLPEHQIDIWKWEVLFGNVAIVSGRCVSSQEKTVEIPATPTTARFGTVHLKFATVAIDEIVFAPLGAVADFRFSDAEIERENGVLDVFATVNKAVSKDRELDFSRIQFEERKPCVFILKFEPLLNAFSVVSILPHEQLEGILNLLETRYSNERIWLDRLSRSSERK